MWMPSTKRIERCIFCSSSIFKQSPDYVTFPLNDTLTNLMHVHEGEINFHHIPPPSFPVSDIYNSKIYRDAVATEGAIFAVGVNTDGVQKFKKSANSMYPVFLQVYNLKKEIRQKPENLVIYGLYNGKSIPIESIIEPLADEMNFVNSNGGLATPVGNIPIFCLNACMDSVARPKFQKHRQFNGEFGCYMCYNKGTHIGGSWKYPNM